MTPRALDIADRIALGNTVQQIATQLRVTRTAVYAILQRHHIPLPTRSPPKRQRPDPDAPRPDWSHPSPELRLLAHTIRAEILAAWHPDA